MTTPSESVVLCEGYHDRSFWSGWLLDWLGCTDARRRDDGSLGDALDPFTRRRISGGDFAFLGASRAFFRVRPCHGDSKVLDTMTSRLLDRATKKLRRLVVNLDTDADDGDADRAALRAAGLLRSVEHRVREADPGFLRTPDGDFSLDAGATLVSVVLWQAVEDATPELPAKQTLERLVCASLRAAYPARAAKVAAWLASRPDPPRGTAGLAKEHAWSHMAGWYAGNNCDDFYQAVWRDAAVAGELEGRLRATGAWRVAEALAI